MVTYNLAPHIAGDTWPGIPLITIQRNGSALDLTGAQVHMQVRSSIDGPLYLELTTADGIIITDPPTEGTIRILPRIVDIPVGNYVFDLKIILGTNDVYTEIGGNWQILSHVTR